MNTQLPGIVRSADLTVATPATPVVFFTLNNNGVKEATRILGNERQEEQEMKYKYQVCLYSSYRCRSVFFSRNPNVLTMLLYMI